jgi:putative methionine-R-sulfoxide reductase with GAF domain/ligand-binding sensor protein
LKLVKEEINKICEKFIEDERFFLIREELENLGSFSYYLINQEGEIVYNQSQDTNYCRIIKAIEIGKKRCESFWVSVFRKTKELRKNLVLRCSAKCLAFSIPLFVEDELIGVFFGCQIKDPTINYNEIKIDRLDFYTHKNNNIIKVESLREYQFVNSRINLIQGLCQMLIDLVVAKERLYYKDIELKNLEKFYELLETKTQLIEKTPLEDIYSLIVDLVSEAMNTEICSLVICEDNYLVIKSAKGLPQEIINKIKLRLGEGIVGYVAKTKQPLLVKDISKDTRFNIPHKPYRYYTKSLISAPLVYKNKILGVLNVNNEVTRRPFNESDLKVLCKISDKIAKILGSKIN